MSTPREKQHRAQWNCLLNVSAMNRRGMAPKTLLLCLLVATLSAGGAEPNGTVASEDDVAAQCILEQSVMLKDLNDRCVQLGTLFHQVLWSSSSQSS